MTPVVIDKETNKLDLIAMWISLVCLAHCLLLPIIFAVLPFLGELGHDNWVHKTLVLLALPTSVFALYRSGGWQVFYLAALAFLGVSLLGTAAFIDSLYAVETPLSVVGACILAFVHYKNSRLHKCKSANCSHEIA